MRKILLIGDQILDEYIIGDCDRICPEAPVPIINMKKKEIKSGGAGNVGENLKALGADVDFWHGDKEPTIKTRVISGHQQIVRIDRDNPTETPPPKSLPDKVQWADIVMLCDYNQGVVNNLMVDVVNYLAAKHGKKVIVDPYRNRVDYGKVDLIKPNRKEVESVVGIKINGKKSLTEAGKKYLKLSKAQNLVITLGHEGMALFDYFTYKDNPMVIKPYKPKEIIDVTGAGDTVFAVLGYIWSYEHFSKSTSLKYATKAASIAVSRFGCAVVKGEEIFEANNRFH
jgi:D-beta-D-heptose 7-phosphate kinase/D-beta-D-heptose 1-phosphate adenosyltransferase